MKLKSALMLASVVFLWGSSFTLLKLGLEEIPPVTLAFLRFLIVLPFFMTLVYFQNKTKLSRCVLERWKIFSMLGLTGITLYHIFQNFGLQLTTASHSSLMISMNPVLIALLGRFYLKEQMTLKRVLGVTLAFFGVVLVIRPFEFQLNPKGVVGDLLSLGAALSWAFYSVLSKRVLFELDVNKVTLFSIVFGVLFLFPSMFIFERPVLPVSAWNWVLLLILGLFCSGLAYLFWIKALKSVTTTEAGVFLFFLPVVSVSVAHLVLSEPLDLLFGMGALLVMVGVALTERG
jgi:drug/metabolite transporter (DMT)-like permease